MKKFINAKYFLTVVVVVFFLGLGVWIVLAETLFSKNETNPQGEAGEITDTNTEDAGSMDRMGQVDAEAIRNLLSREGITGKNEMVRDHSGNCYYLGEDGTPQGGFYRVQNVLNYFNRNGSLCTTAGWIRDVDDWYYVNADGTVRESEVFEVKGKLYYAGRGGKLTGGFHRKDGRKWYFDKDGVALTDEGWIEVDGKKYYTDSTQGILGKGKQSIDGKYYFFDADGALLTGRIDVDERTFYYAGEDGVILTDQEFTLDDRLYRADEEGLVSSGSMYAKAQDYYSDTDYLILCNLTTQTTAVFEGSMGNWKLIREMTCSTGAPINPTPKGEYKTTVHTLHFNNYGVRAWYATGFIGGLYLFHSSPYKIDSEPRECTDPSMGYPASHGCVRMRLEDAKWMYDTLPLRTKVVIYEDD